MIITPEQGWISLWRHFFNRERTSSELTASMVEWQDKWNWDFLKNNPPACYHALDWGAEYEFYTDPYREPSLVKARIRNLNDLNQAILETPSHAVLSDQLQTIRNLRQHYGPNLPIVHTVFSPIEIAHRLMPGRPMLLDFLRTAPTAVESLLRKITDVFREFCLQCLDAGADGIFFATKWASSRYFSWPEYERFGKPFEREILSALRSRNAWIILHVCGENTHLSNMMDYDSDVISYDFFSEGAMSPERVIGETGKWVLGGIDQDRLLESAEDAFAKMEPCLKLERWMAGPSCVVHPQTPDASIERLKSLYLQRSDR